MASLAAAVARLDGLVGLFAARAAAGLRAVARDVAKLAAAVALDGVGLAVARKVVVAAALVAHDSASTAKVAAPVAASTATSTAAAATTTTTPASERRRASFRVALRAVASEMACASAGVASATATAASATGFAAAAFASLVVGAICLEMADAATRVALLGVVAARLGTVGRFVARLLAVVAQAIIFGAAIGKVANIATLETTFTTVHHDGV